MLPAIHLNKYGSTVEPERLNDMQAAQLYYNSLLSASEKMSKWAAETTSRHDKDHAGVTHLANTATCPPADLLVLMESYWVPHHAGTDMPDGSLIASPARVNQCLSNLSTGFQLIGRIGDCSPLNLSGNPTKSIEVTQYPQGYKQKAFQIGYLEGSAVPMTGNKAFPLVDYSDSTAAATSAGFSCLVLEQDIVMILLLWESYLRGKDCGKVCLIHFFHPHGRYPLPCTVPAGCTLLLAPYGTKTVRGQRAAPVSLPATGRGPQLCTLSGEVLTSARHGALFPILSIGLQSSIDAAMSSSAIGQRLKLHLTAANLYTGDSNHAFRRGHIQSDAAAGLSTSQIGVQAQIATDSIVELEKNPIRHLPRVDRQRKRLFAALSHE